jgi:hypothetical protein
LLFSCQLFVIYLQYRLDLEDFAKIIEKTYGLKDLDQVDFPEDDNDPAWLTPGSGELYHYRVVDKKLFTWFLIKWSS